MGAHRFEELEVFQRAYKVSLEIHRFTQTMPKSSNSTWRARSVGQQLHLCQRGRRRFIQMSIGSADEMRVGCATAAI